MSESAEFRFQISAYTPDTLPMARLAEYMADLATMLGEPASVHFVRIEQGSVQLVHRVEREATPKVRNRVRRVGTGEAPPDALRAYRALNKRLKEDNSVGVLKDEFADIIRFPGRDAVEAVTFGAFSQEGSLDGTLIRIGGATDPVPVHLEFEVHRFYVGYAKRGIAQRMGAHLFKEVRVLGDGRWLRDAMGSWSLERFTIQDFQPLDDAPLSSVVEKLRKVRGTEWSEIPDPWAELRRLRHGPENGAGDH